MAYIKEKIEVLNYASEILAKLKSGILLTTKAGNKVNSMTIAWGNLGIEWNKPIFMAYVREHRFTREQLDKNAEFTINIPYIDGNKALDKKILSFCGTKSGRKVDKAEELGLTLVEGEEVSVPAVAELPLTLECKVIYKQAQEAAAIPEEIRRLQYPENVDGSFCGSNKDYHTAYYGEIVAAYIIK